MTAFILAGHYNKAKGAMAHGFIEGDLMKEFRDKVVHHYGCMFPKAKVIVDRDDETLRQVLARIKTGDGSVVVEFHLDWFADTKVSGISSWVGDDADKLDLAMAKEFAKEGARVLGIPNRGVFKESVSFHKTLGIMRESGTVCIVEICPITNKKNVETFIEYMDQLAVVFAKIIHKYEEMV